MIKIPFPMYVTGQLEKDICKWVMENARLGNPADHIIFDSEEDATVFKLLFEL